MTNIPDKDYYNILGVKPDATQEEIKKQYRFLANRLHPEKQETPEYYARAEETFKLINEAYQILSNPDKRKVYDRNRGSISTGGSSATPPPPPRIKPEIVLSTNNLDFGVVIKGGHKTKSFTIENLGGMPDNKPVIDWETLPLWAYTVISTETTYIFPIEVTVQVKTGKLDGGYYSGCIMVVVDEEEFRVSVSLRVVEHAPAPIPPAPPRPRPTPAHATEYIPPPPATNKVPYVIILGAAVILVIILAIGNSGQSSQITTRPVPSQVPTLSIDQAITAVSGLVHLQSVSLTKSVDLPGEYFWERSFQVKNDSDFPITILHAYWDSETHYDDLRSATWFPDPGWCISLYGNDSYIKGPSITFDSSTFVGQNPHSLESYSCHGDNTLAEIGPENHICIVYYPLLDSTYNAIESDSGPAPILICTP